MISALPLNISLGAFSPALVVGDGEISFADAKDAEGLVNTLSGASAGSEGAQNGISSGAAKAKTGGTASKADGVKRQQKEKVTASSRSVGDMLRKAMGLVEKRTEDDKLISERAEIQKLSPRISLEKRDLAGFLAALKFAEGALNQGPSIDLGTGEGGSGVGVTIRPPGGGNVQAVGA